MKLFDIIKNQDYFCLKILNIMIYEAYRNRSLGIRIKDFFKIFKIDFKFLDCYNYISEKRYKIFNKTFLLFRREDNGEYLKKSVFGFTYKKIFLQQELKKKIINKIGKKYDSVYVLNGNSGEVYLFLTYVIKYYLLKNNSQYPLIVATRKYHVDMVNVICPELPCIIVNKINRHLKNLYFNIDNIMLYLIFPQEYYLKVEDDIRKHNSETPHYFLSMLKQLSMSSADIKFNPIKITKTIEESMINKIKSINLNLNKFIILSPEASSCKWIDIEIWKKIINHYNSLGFDIFVNTQTTLLNFTDLDTKSCDLTFPEIFALGCYAKKIISLRSGLIEFLSQTGVPIDVIYTDFERLDGNIVDEDIKKGFSLLRLPYINKNIIKEYTLKEYVEYLEGL